MSVIDDFVSEYERQYDYWEASARVTRGILEAELDSAGLRAIVTSRAKSVERLLEKLRQRDRRTPYRSMKQIREDIPDLAGVRVALYFPGQIDEVERIIEQTLDVRVVKRFPPDSRAPDGAETIAPGARALLPSTSVGPSSDHRQRFSGYGARHFRVYIPDSRLSENQKRYAAARIEVQVASVLMHAWSEVEHDLVYKPLEGLLSASEYALLDQLNGLVLAGEIALEQLQQAGDARVAAAETPFRDHYELAEFLRARLPARGIDLNEGTLGRVDVLFQYLAEQNSATASQVEPYLELLEQNVERRPVAAQLADFMLSGNEEHYRAYLRATSTSRHPSARRRTPLERLAADSPTTMAVGKFVSAWVLLEAVLTDLAGQDSARSQPIGRRLRELARQGLISEQQLEELDSMRDLRNQVMHGNGSAVPPERLAKAAARLREITEEINGGPRA